MPSRPPYAPSPSSPPGAVEKLPIPRELFTALYHRFLCAADRDLYPTATITHAPTHAPSSSSTLSQPAASGAPAPLPALLCLTAAQGGQVQLDTQDLCLKAMAAVYHVHAGRFRVQLDTQDLCTSHEP